MKLLVRSCLILLVFLLGACATPRYQAVPEGFSGPVAFLRDTSDRDGITKGLLFFAEEIDGNKIDDSGTATRRASTNTGFSVFPQALVRRVPIRTMKVKLVGKHVVGAPIHEMTSRMIGTFFEVEGVVEFTPVAGKEYVVRGELKKGGSSVWIEDASDGQPVTQKIVGK